jgi:SAM-dependent methyltransferase
MMFDAAQYWEKRLSDDFSVTGTGHCGFSRKYNRFMYRLKRARLERARKKYNIAVAGKAILDIGCGTGFFVSYYLDHQAASVTGVDITDASVNRLRELYPSAHFCRADIGSEDYNLAGTWDIVNIFDVLYHIIDDVSFDRAISHISAAAKPGGWIFITDRLSPSVEGAHVRFRSREQYERALSANNIQMIEIVPVFHLLGSSFANSIAGPFARRIGARLVEAAAFLSYIADSWWCPSNKASLYLLVCKKR